MQITVNGEPREVQGPQPLSRLLAELALPTYNGMAVLLNGEVVRRSDWPDTVVQADDALEIVRATVGG